MRRIIFFSLIGAALLATPAPRHTLADEYLTDIQICLQNWKTHPFQGETPPYRVIAPQVKVFGIGGNVDDTAATPEPELIYIQPNVSVMSKTVLNLMNPNGWYCIASNVSVMSKVEINLSCKAHLTSSKEGVAVLGGGQQGVNVLGATQVNIVGCD